MTPPGQRFPFVRRAAGPGTAGLAPVLPVTLQHGNKSVAAAGLLDTGAAINVLPFSVGLRLGLDWGRTPGQFPLAGNLGGVIAKPVKLDVTVGVFPPVILIFGWAQVDAVPLLLGQTNFFDEFDVCFFRSRAKFEIHPKP